MLKTLLKRPCFEIWLVDKLVFHVTLHNPLRLLFWVQSTYLVIFFFSSWSRYRPCLSMFHCRSIFNLIRDVSTRIGIFYLKLYFRVWLINTKWILVVFIYSIYNSITNQRNVSLVSACPVISYSSARERRTSNALSHSCLLLNWDR